MTSRHVYISAITWLREPAAEAGLQRGDDLHALQRVEPHLGDGRVQLEADRPVLADRADHVQHDLGRRLECLPARPSPGRARSASGPSSGRPRRRLGCARAAAARGRRDAPARRGAGRGAAATGSSLPRRDATRPPRPGCGPGTRRGRRGAGSCRWRSWGCSRRARARSSRPRARAPGPRRGGSPPITSAASARWCRSSSRTITSFCSGPSSTVKAAPQPARTPGGSWPPWPRCLADSGCGRGRSPGPSAGR